MSQWILKMSDSGSIAEAGGLLIIVQDKIDQTLPQIIHILHLRLVDSLLNYAPDFVHSWIEVKVVRRPQIWGAECRSSTFKIVDRFACSMHGGTVLLKNKELSWQLTYGRWQTVATFCANYRWGCCRFQRIKGGTARHNEIPSERKHFSI